jgi:hypothetical protein
MSHQFTSLLALPATLTGTVAANRFVTKAYAQAGADGNTLGVARSGGGSGDKVTVDVLGTAIVEAGAAVSAGDTIKADSSGRAITWASSGAKVGLALQAASGAGVFIEVLLIPNVA